MAELYHENSKLPPVSASVQPEVLALPPLEFFLSSRGFRQYRTAPRIRLPEAVPSNETLSDVMGRRRCSRTLEMELSLDDVSTLLHQSLGPTAVLDHPEVGVTQAFRAWPSAGALYPLDTYFIAQRVESIIPGLFHYNLLTHEIERLPSRPAEAILRDGFFQDFVWKAALTILLVAVFERTVAKYGARGYRLVLLDAGHAAQNVLLTAEQLGIGACPIGGFCDDNLTADIGLDGVAEAVVYAIALGRP